MVRHRSIWISYTQKSSRDLCPSYHQRGGLFRVDTHCVATAFQGCVVVVVVVPVTLENESNMEGRHDGVLELDSGMGEDGLVGCREALFAEVLEDLSEDDRFAVLEV